MKQVLAILPLLLLASLALAGQGTTEACKRLCEGEGECLRKCVAQVELFELKRDFIEASTEWSAAVDTRMRVLRSGANMETISICKKTGWSEENKLTCLRSYPTPGVMKNCKKLSSLEDEQVRCVRTGKTEAEIDACTNLVPGSDLRLECLQRDVTALEVRQCNRSGLDSRARMQCLERWHLAREEESKIFELEVRRRVAEEKRLEQSERRPASSLRK